MSSVKPTILVTGSTGSNGSQVVKILSSNSNVNVKAAVRDINSDNAKKLKECGSNVSLVALSEDEKSANEAFKAVDTAVIIAPFSADYNVLTGAWLNAAKKNGVKHIVYLSAAGVGPNSPNGPLQAGKWKYANEQFIIANFPSYTIVQPSFFHDNLAKYSAAGIKGYGQWSDNSKDGPTSFVDCRDISAVIAAGASDPEKHSKKTYVCTGPAALTGTQQAELLSKYMGKTVKYTAISDEEYEKNLLGWGTPAILAHDFMVLNQFRALGYSAGISPHVKEVTGKDPISFEQWAKDNAKVFA
jgi:uncharacterized protein YbjT (DUF2867 family)